MSRRTNNMGFLATTGVFLFLCVALRGADGVKCFTCDRMAYPRDCPYIAECGPHEECYLRKYETVDGHEFFTSGCRDKLMCNTQGKRELESAAVERSNFGQEIPVCQECCDTDHCNYGGCGEPGRDHIKTTDSSTVVTKATGSSTEAVKTTVSSIVPAKTTDSQTELTKTTDSQTELKTTTDSLTVQTKSTYFPTVFTKTTFPKPFYLPFVGFPPRGSRGPICYNCKQQQTDSSCNEVAVCGRDQACFVQVAYDVIYDHVYNSYCGTVDLCNRISIVGRKRSLPVHCCTDDLCISGFNATHAQSTAAPAVTTPAGTPAATVAPVTTAPAPTNATAPRCPPITSQFRNSCYYFSTEVKYWNQGQQICIARGGNLVAIDDQDENDFINSQLKQKLANGEIPTSIWGYYIGAHLVNGHWQKPDGTRLTFTNWGPGEPDLPSAQPYGLIFLPGQYVGHYFWGSNADIDGVERYICEIKLH